MIKLSLHNKYYIRIDTDNYDFLRGLYDYLSDYISGYQFMPSYKAGLFNGKKSLVDRNSRTIPFGLLSDLLKYYKEEFKEEDLIISDEVRNLFRFENYNKIDYSKTKLNFDLRDYQEDIVKKCIKYKNGCAISATASGKSFTMTFLMKVLIDNNIIKKPLLIVPRTDLVFQFKKDMISYGIDENEIGIVWGEEKQFDKKYTISTWQSLKNFEGTNFYEEVDCLLIDETHKTSNTNILCEISRKCINAKFRLGFTGTIANDRLRELQVRSFFGPILCNYDSVFLQKKGYLSPCEIKAVKINFDKTDFDIPIKQITKDEIFKSNKRLRIIRELISSQKEGPSIILVDRIEKEGIILRDYLKGFYDGKRDVVFVSGKMSPKKRDKIYERCRKNENLILIVLYSIFQEGLNITNLLTLILASPSSSFIRVLQTIGRGLRNHENKIMFTLYDIVDCVKGRQKFSYSYDTRKEFYNEKEFEIQEIIYK